MVTVIGPSNFVFNGGFADPPSDLYTIDVVAGEVLSGSWSSAIVDPSGGAGWELNVRYAANPGNNQSFSFNSAFPQAANSWNHTTTAADTITIEVQGGGGWVSTPAGLHFYVQDFVVDITNPGGGFCQYGTETNPAAQIYTILTIGLVDTLAVLLGMGPLGVLALDTMIGSPITFPVCSTQPPAAPTFTSADYFPGTQILTPTGALKAPAALANALWFFYCQCTPATGGSPAPVPIPPPSYVAPPTGPGTQPIAMCDNSDLCTSLLGLNRKLDTLIYQVGLVRQDVTLIQRQKVPFSFARGILHSSLTGAGQFAVQDILGVAVQATTVPTSSGEEAGDPIARWGLGWVTTGTTEGWRSSIPIRHNPQWVNVEPDDTLIGYSLEPLVVANIQELAREP